MNITHMYTIAGACVEIALIIELYAVGHTSVDISEDSAIMESLRLSIDIECVSVQHRI